MSAETEPEVPDLDLLSRQFTAKQFLPLAFNVTQPKILDAMTIASCHMATYYNEKLRKLEKEITKLRQTGLKNQ